MATAKTEFISVGANRSTQVAAWGLNGLVAFGAHHMVALYYPEDPTSKGIVTTLLGHTGRVNCVEFIQRGEELSQQSIALVSGSADKNAKIWKCTPAGIWVNSATLTGHTGAINTITTMRARSIVVDSDLIITGGGDGNIKVWNRTISNETEDEVKCIQTIECGRICPMALALSYLPASNVPILAVGSTSKRISIYIKQKSTGLFTHSLSLQGHENWVRSLSFATYTLPIPQQHANGQADIALRGQSPHHAIQEGDVLLASASQDKYIRLWRVARTDMREQSSTTEEEANSLTNGILEALEESARTGESLQLSTKAHIIEVEVESAEMRTVRRRYTIMFEALLLGHDDWVYSVSWQRPLLVTDLQGTQHYHQPLNLVSASSDKSMMLWQPDPMTGVWLNCARMGEVGGHTLGFWGGLFSPDGKSVLAHGYHGSFHLWKNYGDNDEDDWQPQVTISGHFSPVQSLAWDPRARYLISVSLDQTSRLFAPWHHLHKTTQEPLQTWHEIARPQIHGYDIQCISFVNEWTFVSGADEKVLRVFDAPKTFVESLTSLSALENVGNLEERPVGANVPSLGLSNKAVYEDDIKNLQENEEEFLNRQTYAESSSTPTSLVEKLNQPPFEEHLLQHTLWPEIDKLYGHGYEIMAVSATHDGKHIATTCKAASSEHAVIRLFSTNPWKQLPNPLSSHNLTITQARFSHNDRWLLSVSRDRLWSLFEKINNNEESPYQFVMHNKVHSRIIWDCSWSHDDILFATVSRDKTARIWKQSSEETSSWTCIETITLHEAVTAVDFASNLVDESYILALGFEDGHIQLYSAKQENFGKWDLILDFDRRLCHAATVNRLAWRKIGSQSMQLASCSNDHSVRIFEITL